MPTSSTALNTAATAKPMSAANARAKARAQPGHDEVNDSKEKRRAGRSESLMRVPPLGDDPHRCTFRTGWESGHVSFLDTLLGRKHPPMIGLDISSSSVKLVELSENTPGEYVLERFASESFEKGWITDGQIEKF